MLLTVGWKAAAEKGPVCGGPGKLDLSDERLLCCLAVSLRLPARTTVPASPWPKRWLSLGEAVPSHRDRLQRGEQELNF